MTTAEIARALRARRYARGRYMARCPAHRERTGSLSITDMGNGHTRLHCFGGCSQESVLRSAGMTWKDLRPGSVPHEIQGRIRDERRLEWLDRRFAIVLWLAAIDKLKRNYWKVAARRIGLERRELREKLNPELKREREFQEQVRKAGWDETWRTFLESEDGQRAAAKWAVDTRSGGGPERVAASVRADRLHP